MGMDQHGYRNSFDANPEVFQFAQVRGIRVEVLFDAVAVRYDHRYGSPVCTPKNRAKARLSVVTRFIRLHPGAQKGNAANLGSLFEPHYEQNLYANPKRTAKSYSSYYVRYHRAEIRSKKSPPETEQVFTLPRIERVTE